MTEVLLPIKEFKTIYPPKGIHYPLQNHWRFFKAKNVAETILLPGI